MTLLLLRLISAMATPPTACPPPRPPFPFDVFRKVLKKPRRSYLVRTRRRKRNNGRVLIPPSHPPPPSSTKKNRHQHKAGGGVVKANATYNGRRQKLVNRGRM